MMAPTVLEFQEWEGKSLYRQRFRCLMIEMVLQLIQIFDAALKNLFSSVEP